MAGQAQPNDQIGAAMLSVLAIAGFLTSLSAVLKLYLSLAGEWYSH